MLNPSRNLLDVEASWGAASSRQGPFTPESCWALRMGRAHLVQPDNFSLLCAHIEAGTPDSHLCIPMLAQGESLGVLSVSDPSLSDSAADSGSSQQKRELAVSLGEQISLALANLMLRETLKYQSVRDPLTGLFNRRHMEEALGRELLRAVRNETTVSVLMIDIDHFKQFNDAFGHEAGDIVLRDLGALFTSEVRGGDIACRYGGEEFLLILADADLQTAGERAERLNQLVRNMHISHGGETLRRITMSIGIACAPQHGSSAAQIVQSADEALYTAKARGRDRIVLAGECSVMTCP
jgi:diguanylate cyclase (GGDEF)-like protein